MGLGGFHISGVASGRPRCGGGFRGDDGCTPSMGLSVDTEFSSVVRDSDSPLVWVTQKPHGGSPGPSRLGFTSGMGAASNRMAGRLAEMDCSDWAVAYGGPGSHGSYVEPGSTPF